MADAPRRLDRSIVLVGLPGAGKTVVGGLLARRLGVAFADSDAEVERAAGMKVAKIFAREGEAGFRERERRAVARLAEGPPRVIALGGGAFADDSSRRAILQRCLAVRLDADLEILTARTADSGDRPLLGGDPSAALADLARRRESAHAEAPLAVRSDGGDPKHVVEAILAALAEQAR